MPEFRMDRDVTSVSGTQTYKVQAVNKEEALALFKKGKGIFVSQDIDVEDLETFENSEIYEI